MSRISQEMVLYLTFFLPLSFSLGHTFCTSGEVQQSVWEFCVRKRALGEMGDEERNLVPVVSQEMFSYFAVPETSF